MTNAAADYVTASAAANAVVAEMDRKAAEMFAPAGVCPVATRKGDRRSAYQTMGRIVAGRIVADRRATTTDRRAAVTTVGSFCWGG